MKESQLRWSVTSPSFLVSAALAAFMLFLGVRGLLAPEGAAHGFGLGLSDSSDAIWLRIKGDRDVTAGLGIAVFLALRWRRALGALLLASIASPLLDCLLSLATPGHNTMLAIGMHGGATVLVAVLGVVLVRPEAASVLASASCGSGPRSPAISAPGR